MSSQIPQRQIRAHLPSPTTITVYQAYNSTIASAAVSAQKLNASPTYKTSRMTWIKPSWCWMLYRAGYSYKDSNQSNILAITMTRKGFIELLRRGVLSTHDAVAAGEGSEGPKRGEGEVRVQWDPERGSRLERYEYRSIQIGIPGLLVGRWIDEWIVGIEDVTEMARALKKVVDEEADAFGQHEMDKSKAKKERLSVEQFVEKGIHPKEEVVDWIPEDIRERLKID